MKVLKIADRFVSAISLLLFGTLTGFSLFFTVYYTTEYQEIPYEKADILPLVVVVCTCLVFFMYKVSQWILACEEKAERRIQRMMILVLLYAAVFGAVWVSVAHCRPVGDQASVCLAAEGFQNGDFSMLTLDSYEKYLYIHPHQLGLTALIELVYALFGNGNYQAFEYLNCLGAVVCVYSGYRITRLLTDQKRAWVYYLFLAAGCFPLFFFVTFVYGEVPSIAWSMLAIWLFLEYQKRERFGWFAGSCIAVAVAYLVRNNSVIVLIAMVCVLLVCALGKKRWRPAVLAAGMTLVVLLFNWGLHSYYEKRVGFELNEGAPMILYIAMGMQEGDRAPGWSNGYILHIYWGESEFDGERSTELAVADIRNSLQGFAEDPAYMGRFYLKKFTSQWNDPTYQSFVMTHVNEEARSGVVNSMYDGKLQWLMTWFMNQYQSLVFAGVFLYVIYRFWDKRPLEHQVLLIVIIGGFLFHMIWEAKGRYILPYFVAMLPMAAVGLAECSRRIARRISGMHKKNEVADS